MNLSPPLKLVTLFAASGALLQYAVLTANEACNVDYEEGVVCSWDGTEGCAISTWLECKDWCGTGNVQTYFCTPVMQAGTCEC